MKYNKAYCRRIILCIAILLICALLCHHKVLNRNIHGKGAIIEKTIAVLKELKSIGDSIEIKGKRITQIEERRIEEIIDEFAADDVEKLSLIANITVNMAFPMRAGDQSYDDVYECAFWHSINKIKSINSLEATSIIHELGRRYGTDGEFSIRFKDIIYRQENSLR